MYKKILLFGIIFFIFMPDIVHSQEVQKQPKKIISKKFDFTNKSTMPRYDIPDFSIGYLVAVLFILGPLIVLVIWILKKISSGKFSSSKKLILKESLFLGNKTFIHALEIEGKMIIIGTGPNKISYITEFPVIKEAFTSDNANPPQISTKTSIPKIKKTQSEFMTKFSDIMSYFNSSEEKEKNLNDN